MAVRLTNRMAPFASAARACATAPAKCERRRRRPADARCGRRAGIADDLRQTPAVNEKQERRARSAECCFPEEEHWAGLPLHYLFGEIPVGVDA